MNRFLLSTVAAVALSVPAFAADLGAAPDYSYAPAPAENASVWAAYFDIHGGYGFGDQSESFYDEDWDEGIVGGAMRIAAFLSSTVSVQGDVWASYWNGNTDGNDGGDYNYDFNTLYVGAGGHLTYNVAPGSLVGVLASYGWVNADSDLGDSDSQYANVGLEAAHNFGAFRAYGQGGYTVAVNGDDKDAGIDSWYGVGKLTYYFNDNFSLSGNLGYARVEGDGGYEYDNYMWGATIESKPWDLPVSLYTSYQGSHAENDDDFEGNEHVFLAGLKFMANAPSVRDLDQTVGLKDANWMYGDFP